MLDKLRKLATRLIVYDLQDSTLVMDAANEIERLRANQERMWCKSCGTVTRDGECDCTRFETGTQRLVNYADSLSDEIGRLQHLCDEYARESAKTEAKNERLRAALRPFASLELYTWPRTVSVEDILAARAALNGTEKAE